MSQEQKLGDILREDNQRISRDLTELKAAFLKLSKEQSASTAKPLSTTSPKHKTAKELSECTDCNKEYKFEDYDKSILKKYGESLKGKETVTCKDCGLSVERQKDNCPGCGGTESE